MEPRELTSDELARHVAELARASRLAMRRAIKSKGGIYLSDDRQWHVEAGRTAEAYARGRSRDLGDVLEEWAGRWVAIAKRRSAKSWAWFVAAEAAGTPWEATNALAARSDRLAPQTGEGFPEGPDDPLELLQTFRVDQRIADVVARRMATLATSKRRGRADPVDLRRVAEILLEQGGHDVDERHVDTLLGAFEGDAYYKCWTAGALALFVEREATEGRLRPLLERAGAPEPRRRPRPAPRPAPTLPPLPRPEELVSPDEQRELVARLRAGELQGPANLPDPSALPEAASGAA